MRLESEATDAKGRNAYGEKLFFLTICTYRHQCTLGAVFKRNNKMIWRPTYWGKAAAECMEAMPHMCPSIPIESHVIMPNHVHMIVRQKSPHAKNLYPFVRAWKAFTSRKMYALTERPYPVWDTSFHALRIRSEMSYYTISKYIEENRSKWHYDKLYLPQ